MILFDTNILVHTHAVRSPFHVVAKRLRDHAAAGDIQACFSPQILCEFYAVTTNPRLFQPALTPQQASREVGRYWTQSAFQKILPMADTIPRLLKLMERHSRSQQDLFDSFLVATMQDNDVRTIYTQNAKDFEFYHEIKVINPLVVDEVARHG